MKKTREVRGMIWGFILLAFALSSAFFAYMTRMSDPAALRDAGQPVKAFLSSAEETCDEDKVRVKVSGVGIDPYSESGTVFLIAEDKGLYIPIFVGSFEAAAISRSLEGIKPARPLTHELLSNVIAVLDAKTMRAEVRSIEHGTFKATLYIEKKNGQILSVDARPSDSIAIAVLEGADIFVHRRVMEEAGYSIQEDIEPEPPFLPEPEDEDRPKVPDAELI